MTPAQFVKKWSDSQLRERQASQSHFNDLCALLGVPNPIEDDPVGERYCFERGASKTGGGDGWADVWRKGCFGWEYKGKHKNLDAALRQLQAYALDLQNPPYLVVSDMERIIVHTNWTNTVSRKLVFTLDDMLDPEQLAVLRLVFEGSESLKPKISPQELTAKVAQRFGDLGRRLQERGHNPRDVAHFLNRLVFCMFAEDAKLLPEGLFTRLTRSMQLRPAAETAPQFNELFAKMSVGGLFGADVIKWFNGGLFDDKPALPLERADVKLICDTAAEHDWSDLDPSVFGNMFEEALKATRERAALGAHYTDREKILKIIDPVITWPLMAEWDAALAKIREALDARAAAEVERKAVLEAAAEAMRQDPVKAKAGEAARRKALTAIAKRSDAALGQAKDQLEAFLGRLSRFRVLDPACGSGNFLYVALHALKDIERRALVDAQRLGLEVPAPRVGLACVRGIEIEEYAAELARVTLWIGDLQWNAKNNYTGLAEPILSSLDQIECRDALLNKDGTEAEWPAVDVIVGNPPFLGGKKLLGDLGENHVEKLRAVYRDRVAGGADFVCYWVEKAWRKISSEEPTAVRAGFVTTNSIRDGASRKVLDPIADAVAIYEAWADEPWTLQGAAVRVSMTCFGNGFIERRLEGRPTTLINADLTGSAANIVRAERLTDNGDVCFEGGQKFGAFDIPGDLAREWLVEPRNPNGLTNSSVLRPLLNGADLVRRSSDTWVIDFEAMATEREAAFFEKPFEYALKHVKPERDLSTVPRNREFWWKHHRARPELRQALIGKQRYIGTPVVAKYRTFVWLDTTAWPSNLLDAIARDDDTTFGVLQSRFHELWSLRMGSSLEDRPRYTPSTTFETFPFPEGLTPNIPAADYANDPRAQAIAAAAAELNRLREAWLNPPDLVKIEPEVVPGYPDRILPVSPEAAAELKKRTLTNLYNQRPAWLDMAHQRLDAAVAAAYGWPEGLSDDEVLERLFALNQERAAAGR
ncbi:MULTISPECIES: class I SAM-dependent DNA methyltransferase [unclassified Caulobacter]|uniref:class I SAM-dependent DNA methyltransferase n=1 Tax=unclassified Caulobacter TaxID=2648921 RepID=UPI000785AAA9|nr:MULTISPECIES: class I SAM-dependent DNA methyltransferase [unclassified Caulobacter]AZS22537.1 class I SAM-dependent DNA methyltransferase [Caulobacter sp. FWC26]